MAKLMRRTLKFGIFVTFAACLALPALAAGPAGGGLADLEIGGTTIHMSPLSTARLSLRVTGPGDFVYEAEAKGGEGFDFGIFDAAGDVLADGIYHYEITAWGARPKAATAENLRGLEKSRAVTRSQAGVFTIRGGALVDPGLEEAVERPAQKAERQVTTKSQVFTQDVVIEASLCVGFDCVNGESFGSDTLKLKENNLRIFFDDTSNSGSFPKNDWRIVANDTSNGGASYLAVEDATAGRYPFRIEAGAPSNSLYVEDGGRIGMGTSTPVVQLHVKDGNTPTLRLEQDGSSGFTAQTWDVAGNETNFFVRDATNGSKLPFRIKPNAPTNSIFVKESSGDVGLGTASPDAELDIESDGPNFRLTNTGTGSGIWDFRVESLNGRLTVTDDSTATRNPFKIGTGADDNLIRIGLPNASTVEVNGTLAVTGSVTVDGVTVHPDYVFAPDFALPSIEEHAASMWENKHLPGLPKAPEGMTGPVDLVSHQMGMLEELETAHIYIEQLHSTIQELEKRLEALEGNDD